MATFDQITSAFVQQFDAALMRAAQQSDSRLQKTVIDKGTITGESFTHNGLGTVEMDEKLVRLAPTVLSAIEHTTRVANMRDYFKAIPLDRADIPKMLINPVTGGDYIASLVAARNRKIDSIIWEALDANQLMKDGSTTALPSGQKILAGATGFTKAKAIQAKKLFRKNESDEHAGEELYIAYDDEMLEDILTDTTLTSSEFMAGKALQAGDVAMKWMGFTWVPYQHTTRAAGTARTKAWAKRGVKFGRAGEEGDVAQRKDLQNAWQTSLAGSYGALRTQETLVVTIEYTY
jgi:uncharacterized protein YfeS